MSSVRGVISRVPAAVLIITRLAQSESDAMPLSHTGSVRTPVTGPEAYMLPGPHIRARARDVRCKNFMWYKLLYLC